MLDVFRFVTIRQVFQFKSSAVVSNPETNKKDALNPLEWSSSTQNKAIVNLRTVDSRTNKELYVSGKQRDDANMYVLIFLPKRGSKPKN